VVPDDDLRSHQEVRWLRPPLPHVRAGLLVVFGGSRCLRAVRGSRIRGCAARDVGAGGEGILMAKLTTDAQRKLIRKLYGHEGWYRARTHGERVTLASLFYRGFAERQVWRGEGGSSPAHEYRLTAQLREAMDRKRAVAS
jgi:hypothetical protein